MIKPEIVAERKRLGLCFCGRERAEGYRLCTKCRERFGSYYEKKKKNGECTQCGSKVVVGTTKCSSCTEKRRGLSKKRYEDMKIKKICKECLAPIDEGGSAILCNKCRLSQNLRMNKAHSDLKIRIMKEYGGKCVCCGEQNIYFLTIDHTYNDGNEHRKEVDGSVLYRWLEKNGYPKDRFQILCWNCNNGKRLNNGVCPHKGIYHA